MSRAFAVATSVFLAVFSLVAQNFQSNNQSNKTTVARDYSFSVPASEVWTDTGLDLQPGQLVHIYGGVIACGGPAPSEKSTLPLPSAPAGTLLAKLHAEAKPVLATPDAELPVTDPSHLYLGVNRSSCSGSLLAKVHVQPARSTP
jgi:hypothetical protein